jgi:hypothetical protein
MNGTRLVALSNNRWSGGNNPTQKTNHRVLWVFSSAWSRGSMKTAMSRYTYRGRRLSQVADGHAVGIILSLKRDQVLQEVSDATTLLTCLDRSALSVCGDTKFTERRIKVFNHANHVWVASLLLMYTHVLILCTGSRLINQTTELYISYIYNANNPHN